MRISDWSSDVCSSDLTYPDSARLAAWHAAVDKAAELGCDAIIAAEMAVLDYAARTHPALRSHLSVQGSATTAPALRHAYQRFGLRRAVLPRRTEERRVGKECVRPGRAGWQT